MERLKGLRNYVKIRVLYVVCMDLFTILHSISNSIAVSNNYSPYGIDSRSSLYFGVAYAKV